MEISFDRLEAAQREITAAMELSSAKSRIVSEELQGLRGTFPSIEAVVVAQNARFAAIEARLAAIEENQKGAA